jgi:hypothetical protein
MERTLGLLLLLMLALPIAGSAQPSPSPRSDRILIYVYMTHDWKHPGLGKRTEVRTKSGSWIPFPPDGMAIEGTLCAGVAVGLPRERLDEIRRIVEEELEIPPHRWHVLNEQELETIPPHIHSWGCQKF